jgi:hypothetical protein
VPSGSWQARDGMNAISAESPRIPPLRRIVDPAPEALLAGAHRRHPLLPGPQLLDRGRVLQRGLRPEQGGTSTPSTMGHTSMVVCQLPRGGTSA